MYPKLLHAQPSTGYKHSGRPVTLWSVKYRIELQQASDRKLLDCYRVTAICWTAIELRRFVGLLQSYGDLLDCYRVTAICWTAIELQRFVGLLQSYGDLFFDTWSSYRIELAYGTCRSYQVSWKQVDWLRCLNEWHTATGTVCDLSRLWCALCLQGPTAALYSADLNV